MHSRITRFISAALLLALSLPARGQQTNAPPITFQAEVNYVDVDAIVTDAQGNFVGNLTKDDFEVLEDGKPQKVDIFSLVDIPLQRPDRFLILNRPVSSDVKSNRDAFAGRVYVIVLDDLDISPMRTVLTRKQAREFVEKHFGANDMAAVIYTSGRADSAQEFTNDPQLLLAAVDKFVGRRLRSAALDKIDQFYQQMAIASVGGSDTTSTGSTTGSGSTDSSAQLNSAMTDPVDFERSYRALGVLTTLKNVSDYLATVRGRRKAVVMFSEGVDSPMDDVVGGPMGATEVIRALQDAVTAAARANVNFFTIDPRGLAGMTTEFIEIAGSGELAGGASQANGGSGVYNVPDQLLAEMRLSQDSLRTIADETGGFASVSDNSLAGVFDRIVQANSRYYVLGYYPPSHPRDGRFHKIEVRVKRQGLQVSARKGYASARGKTPEEKKRDDEAQTARDAKKGKVDDTSAPLREALGSPMQQSGLAFSVQAAPFKGTDKLSSVALAIEIEGSTLQFAQSNGLFADKIELSFYGLSDLGKVSTVGYSVLNLTLRPETMQRVKAAGLRANPRLTLAPGRYQVRIGARDEASGRLGSVFYDLQVPDFSKDPLMISGVLLSAASADQTPTAQKDPVVEKVLPRAATSRRDFVRSDTISLLAEIYDNSTSRQPRQIDTSVRLLGESGQEAFVARDALTNTGDAKKWDVYAYAKEIPLQNVAPGRYLLRVEAAVRGNQNGAKPVARETLITVR